MDTDLIKSLIASLEASSLSELAYSAAGLRLVKSGGVPPPAAPARAIVPATPQAAADSVTAPMFGTVHLSRSPGLPPFVAPGDA